MKVIICGAGQVGWQIARHLSGEDNDVTVVDNNPALVRRATDTLDVQGVAGFASYPDILERAGAADADMVIAATHSDEVNMVTCQIAHSVFNVRRKVARLRSKSYLDVIYSDLYRRDHMPIDVVISPEEEVAQAALQRLAAPATFDIESFFGGQGVLVGITIDEDCPVINTPLRQLTDLFSTLRALVVAVRRDGELFVPDKLEQLYPSDSCYIFAVTQDLSRVVEIFGKTQAKQDRVVVIGGGSVGLAVARSLEERSTRVRVKVIEKSRETAEISADALERTVVLNGDGLDAGLLKEAQIADSDAVLAVTDDDKTNILASVRAKDLGCKMAISLVNDPSLIPLMKPMGIDAYINPRATTVSSILRHIRQGRVRAVYSIGDAEAEVIEAQVLGTSSIAGRCLREIDFPPGARVAAVMKKGVFVRPSGDTRIEEEDVLTIFALSKAVADVERLLQVSIDFF